MADANNDSEKPMSDHEDLTRFVNHLFILLFVGNLNGYNATIILHFESTSMTHSIY
jgi:hypothetical protein